MRRPRFLPLCRRNHKRSAQLRHRTSRRHRRAEAGQVRAGLSGRRHIRIFVAEKGVPVINLQIPLAAAGFAIDQVPGLSADHRSRIVEAIQTGMTGPILEVSDHGDEVRITIE